MVVALSVVVDSEAALFVVAGLALDGVEVAASSSESSSQATSSDGSLAAPRLVLLKKVRKGIGRHTFQHLPPSLLLLFDRLS